MAHGDLNVVLRNPATWIWDAQRPSPYWLDAPQPAHAKWYHSAYFAMKRTDYPTWGELGKPEQTILVSAMEASGMLTGPL